MKKRSILIYSVAVFAVGAIFTAGGVDEFSYESAQSRHQFRVFGIPLTTEYSNTWITQSYAPGTKTRWHVTKTMVQGVHMFSLAGQIKARIELLDMRLDESAIESDARPIVVKWLTEQVKIANDDPNAVLVVRNRLARASRSDRPWDKDQPEIERMTVEELIAFLEVCAKMN
jgi:hypothetical protein